MELKLKGYFDEFSTLPEDVDLTECEKFHVDFSEIEFINSGGIKLWINFTDTLEEQENLKVYFQNCKSMIVNQINLIKGFLPTNGKVLSAYLPAKCKECDKICEIAVEVDSASEQLKDFTKLLEDPGCGKYPSCASQFEIEVDQKKFFRFNK